MKLGFWVPEHFISCWYITGMQLRNHIIITHFLLQAATRIINGMNNNIVHSNSFPCFGALEFQQIDQILRVNASYSEFLGYPGIAEHF